MDDVNAILAWRDMIKPIIKTFDDYYFLVLDDYKNKTNTFHEPFYSMDKKFKDFEIGMYSLTNQKFRELKTDLMTIKEESERYIENYNTKFYPNLLIDIDNLIKDSSPIVYFREEFLNTNSVKVLFDYCKKVVHMITELNLIKSEEYKYPDSNTKNHPETSLKDIINDDKITYILNALEYLAITKDGVCILSERKKSSLRGFVEALITLAILPQQNKDELIEIIASEIKLNLPARLKDTTLSINMNKKTIDYIKNHQF